MKKQLGVQGILIRLSDGTYYQVTNLDKEQTMWLVSMPCEFGGHGVAVFALEATAKNFAEHIYDDSALRADKVLWEKLHGVEVSPHTIRKISVSSILAMILNQINQEISEFEEVPGDQIRISNIGKTQG